MTQGSERIRMRAAVFRPDATPAIETVDIVELREQEVLVRVVAVGVCHTDLTFQKGFMRLPYPVILGHEGSGVVERVGDRVTKVRPGDHVVLSYLSCGNCEGCQDELPGACDRMGDCNATGKRLDGSSAIAGEQGTIAGHFFGQSSFATYSVAHELNVVKVRKDAPLELLGPLGCGVQTGAGAVMNVLRPARGESFVVFGAGGVGLSAMLAAIIEGCAPIIVVEPNAERRTLALSLGAHEAIDPQAESDLVGRLRSCTGSGIRNAVDTCGVPAVLTQAIAALSQRGKIVLLTANLIDASVTIPILPAMSRNLSIMFSTEGGGTPDVFIPKLVDLVMNGRFPIEKFSRFYAFEEINRALDDQHRGIAVKPILRMA
jgi:aryl-alcohol dehydrogenase